MIDRECLQHLKRNIETKYIRPIDIKRRKNRLLKFCYVPATSAAHNRLLFFLFLLWPFTVLMKQTRQAVCAIKQSMFLDVYDKTSGVVTTTLHFYSDLQMGSIS